MQFYYKFLCISSYDIWDFTTGKSAVTTMQRLGVADLLKHSPPYICYHAEFGPPRSNQCTHKYGNLKIGVWWGHAHLGWRAWLTTRNALPMCYLAEHDHSALKV